MQSGSRLVADAATRLDAVVKSIRDNTQLMRGIAEDSLEQSSAIGEVVVAIRQMDEMTQHNAALVEETNAAIEQTESQAGELDRVVGTFVIGGAAPVERAPTRRPSPARTQTSATSAAARTYGLDGNAALQQDWSEF